jgi:hypothetical protein
MRRSRRWGRQVRQWRRAAGPDRPARQPQAVGSNVADQLRELGSLRDSELLSNAEFEAKKAELLSRL